MRITKYNVELDKDGAALLVKEQAANYKTTYNLMTPDGIVAMLNDVVRLDAQAEERLYLLAFAQSSLKGLFEVSHGCADASFCRPREIFVRCLLCNATAFVIAHNHPSGSVTPSADDINVARRLSDAAELMGIQFLDSIIVGNDGFTSFMASGLMGTDSARH